MEELTAKTQLFDRWAPSYDWLLPSVFYQAIHLRLLEYVQLPESAHVLDLGCGTGRLLNRLAKIYPHLHGTGLDLSSEMLNQARSNRCCDRISFLQGASHDIPTDDDTFEAVFSTISFLHYPNPKAVLKEIRRVLKPQGQFYLVDYTTSVGTLFPQSAIAKMQFYSVPEREKMGQQAHLKSIQHQHLLGPILLTIYASS